MISFFVCLAILILGYFIYGGYLKDSFFQKVLKYCSICVTKGL